MSLRDDMALYTELSGNDGNHTSIGIIGAYLDGYEKGKASAQPERTGYWIDIDFQMYTWKVRCSKCGHERSMMSTQGQYPKFCEDCGTRMIRKDGDRE